MVRELAVDVMEELALDVRPFTNADDALLYLDIHAERVALVFTDVTMPGHHCGLSLARKVAASWPWIAIIVTSGNIGPDADLPLRSSFLAKPWRGLMLIRQVENALHLRH